MRSEEQIREFIKLQRSKVDTKYSEPTYDDASYYRLRGMEYGYEEALDDLELFLDGKD